MNRKKLYLEWIPTDNTNTCSDPNGELEILVTGGRPGVQYTVQVNDSIYPFAVDSNSVITYAGLGMGDYMVTATENGAKWM